MLMDDGQRPTRRSGEPYISGLFIRNAIIESPTPVLTALSSAIDCCWLRPPLSILAQIPVHLTTAGTPDRMAWLVNLPALALLMLFTWLLGRAIFCRWTGLTAAVLVSLFPIVAGHTRTILADLLLTALTVGTVWALVRAFQTDRLRWPVLAGALSGLALLSKLSFPLVVLGPWLWFAYAFHRRHGRPTRLALHVGLAAGAAALLFGPWLAKHHWVIGWYQRTNQLLASQYDGRSTWDLARLSYNLRAIVGIQLLPYWTAVLVACLVAAPRSLQSIRNRVRSWFGLLATWWLVSQGLFLIIALKHGRNGMPLLPAVALLCAAVLSTVAKRRRSLAALGLMAAGAGLLTHYAVGESPWRTHWYLPNLGIEAKVTNRVVWGSGILQPGRLDWKTRRVSRLITALGRKERRPPRVVLATGHHPFFMPIRYYFLYRREEVHLRLVMPVRRSSKWLKRLDRAMKDADLLIVRSSGEKETRERGRWVTKAALKLGYRLRPVLDERYPFTNRITVYGVRGPGGKGAP